MMQSMADEQLALHLATPGIGLSQAILGQMKQGKPGELSADAVKRIGQGSDLDYATGGSRQVSALLGVLRNNRASDRAMAAAEGARRSMWSASCRACRTRPTWRRSNRACRPA